jgi:hypothetical protein
MRNIAPGLPGAGFASNCHVGAEAEAEAWLSLGPGREMVTRTLAIRRDRDRSIGKK